MEKEKRKKLYLITLVIATLLIVPAVFLVSAALWTGNQAPFVYYDFNEIAGVVSHDITVGLNSSGDNINGGNLQWTTGILGNALNISDVGSVRYIMNKTLLDTPPQDFSIQLWFKPHTTFDSTETLNDYLITKTNVASQDRFFISLDKGAGKLQVFAEGNNVIATTLASSITSWTKDTWYHMVFVWDDSGGNLYLYVNGVQNDSTAHTDQLQAGTNRNFEIGRHPDAATEEFNGTVDEFGLWNRSLSSAEVLSLYNNGKGLAFGSGIDITINAPIDTYTFTAANVTINITANGSASNNDVRNATLWLDGVLNSTNEFTSASPSLANTTTFNLSVVLGTYSWFVTACNNASFCDNTTARTFTRSTVSTVNEEFNSSSFETSQETFLINVTADGLQTLTGKLVYNGTEYTGTKSGNDTVASFTRTIDVPIKTGNKSWNWVISYGSTEISQTTHQQNITNINLGLCNGSLSGEYLNISFKDEESLANINGTISASTWTYYLGSGTETKSLSFINNTANYNYEFCASPNTSIFKINPSVQYASSGYPQRIWSPGSEDYDNSSTNKILYLLSSATGQDVTFQVINSVNQVLSGVDIIVNRTIDSVVTTVGSGTTGAEGSLTFFLSKNFIHDFTFEKTGFTAQQLSFAPTQTAYTITLAGGTDALSEDFTKGITASILPSPGTELFNRTTYNFNYSLTSSFWDVSAMGFILKLPNGTILDATNQASIGFLSLNLDTANYSVIVMDYFWTINNTNVTRTTRWNVMNTELTDWSIMHFFTDLNAYLDSGMFGIDNFGRYLIIFIILFVSVGVMSFKFGLASPMTITSLIFAIIFFFDVAVGLLPNPVGAIPNFPTFVAALILIVVIFKEVTR